MVPHPFRRKNQRGWGTKVLTDTELSFTFADHYLSRSLTGVLIVMMVVMMMVTVVMLIGMVHRLRLHRVWYREAEEKHRSQEKFFHTL